MCLLSAHLAKIREFKLYMFIRLYKVILRILMLFCSVDLKTEVSNMILICKMWLRTYPALVFFLLSFICSKRS